MQTRYTMHIARPEDAAGVAALLEATYPESFAKCCPPDVLAVALPLMTRANPQLLASGTFYVVEAPKGGLIGCGGWTHEHPGTGETAAGLGHIRHFATHPDWVRQGIGRALIFHCLQDARACGVQRMECLSSPVAEAFYRAVGFASLHPINVPMAPGMDFPAIRMRLELKDP